MGGWGLCFACMLANMISMLSSSAQLPNRYIADDDRVGSIVSKCPPATQQGEEAGRNDDIFSLAKNKEEEEDAHA